MTDNAITALKAIVDRGLLEDRLEYDIADLARMYGLTAADAVRLFKLLRAAQ